MVYFGTHKSNHFMRDFSNPISYGTKDKINLGKLTMLHFRAKKKHELKELLGFVLEVKRPM